MKKKKEKKEIRVSAPFIPSTPPEEAARRDREMARVEEEIEVIAVTHRVGALFGGVMITMGALLLFSIYLIMTGQVMISPEERLLFTLALILYGIVNMISGLLLMGRG